MALPLLYTLPKTARIAYPFIVAGTRRGLSSRAIERTIRAAGLQISRARSILPIMRDERARIAHGLRLKHEPLNATIDVDKLPHAITRLPRGRYSYTVRITGIDVNYNFIDRFTQVSTDRYLTREQIQDVAYENALDEGESVTLQDISVTLEDGVQRLSPF